MARKQPSILFALGSLICGTAVLAAEAPAIDRCSAIKPLRAPYRHADAVSLTWEAPLTAEQVEGGVAPWEQCRNYGGGFPRFLLTPSPGVRTLTVRYLPSAAANGKCGGFLGSTIVLFAFARGPGNRRVPCGDPADILAHELGHVLGLQDVPSSCSAHVMSSPRLPGHRPRAAHSAECQAVGHRWLTASEQVRSSLPPAAARPFASQAEFDGAP